MILLLVRPAHYFDDQPLKPEIIQGRTIWLQLTMIWLMIKEQIILKTHNLRFKHDPNKGHF